MHELCKCCLCNEKAGELLHKQSSEMQAAVVAGRCTTAFPYNNMSNITIVVARAQDSTAQPTDKTCRNALRTFDRVG